MKKSFNIIVAALKKSRGIGFKNSLPWAKIEEDIKYFSKKTTKTNDFLKINSVIMGRKTWESIPKKYKPLPKRLNIIITSKPEQIIKLTETKKDKTPILAVKSLEEALSFSYNLNFIEKTFVVGGESIYNEAIIRNDLSKIYYTEIDGRYNADTYFPDIPTNFELHKSNKLLSKNSIHIDFMVYRNKKN